MIGAGKYVIIATYFEGGKGMEDLKKIFDEGCELREREDYVASFEKFRYAAEQGYIAAQNSVGDCYYYGEGVDLDEEEAVKWYRQAAKQGYAAAQYMLGDCYKNGWGVEKDETEAVKWYRLAAEQGHSYAQEALDEFQKED